MLNLYYLLILSSSKVVKIDVKQETFVDHGEITCFSMYSGPEANFGGGKSCIWIDVLDGGGKEVLEKFAEFFSDSFIRKVKFSFFFPTLYVLNLISHLNVQHRILIILLLLYEQYHTSYDICQSATCCSNYP